MPLSPIQIVIATAMATAGAVVQGTVGFGLAAVSAPILLFVNKDFVPGPTLFASMLLVMLMAFRERRDVIIGDVGLATAGRVVGMLPAAYLIRILPRPFYEMVFALFVLLGTILSALGRHLPPTRKNVLIGGIGSGFVGTLSSVGGPLMALMYQHEPGPRIRATLGAIFTLGCVVSLSGLWWAGKFGQTEIVLGLLIMPGVLIGFFVSRFTARIVDRAHMRPAVLVISAASAIAVMLRAIVDQF